MPLAAERGRIVAAGRRRVVVVGAAAAESGSARGSRRGAIGECRRTDSRAMCVAKRGHCRDPTRRRSRLQAGVQEPGRGARKAPDDLIRVWSMRGRAASSSRAARASAQVGHLSTGGSDSCAVQEQPRALTCRRRRWRCRDHRSRPPSILPAAEDAAAAMAITIAGIRAAAVVGRTSVPPTVTGAPAPRTSSLGPDGVREANSMRPARPSASDVTGCAKSSDGAMISAMVNTTYLTGLSSQRFLPDRGPPGPPLSIYFFSFLGIP